MEGRRAGKGLKVVERNWRGIREDEKNGRRVNLRDLEVLQRSLGILLVLQGIIKRQGDERQIERCRGLFL